MTTHDIVSFADRVRAALTTPERPHHTPGVRLVTAVEVWLVTDAFQFSDTETDRPDVWTTLDEALHQARRAVTEARETPTDEPTIEIDDDTQRIDISIGQRRITITKALLHHRALPAEPAQ